MYLHDDGTRQAELAPDLEWMLQSSQIDESAVAEALVREYYPLCLALAHCLCKKEEYVRPLAYAALGRALAHRHEYWAEGGLPAWVALQVYQTARASFWLLDFGMLRAFPLALAEAAGLSPEQIAHTLKQPLPQIEARLERLRARQTPAQSQRLAQAAELRSLPAPEADAASSIAGLVNEERGLLDTARRRRLLGLELLLGVVAVLLVGSFSLWRMVAEPPAPTPTRRIVYITATPVPQTPTPTPAFIAAGAALPEQYQLDFSAVVAGQSFTVTQTISAAQSGPQNLAWVLQYWDWVLGRWGGWENSSQTIAASVSYPGDGLVRLEELAGYMPQGSAYDYSELRYNGSLALLERLVAAGFPVIILRSDWSDPAQGWQPRYETIIGYDRQEQRFLTAQAWMRAVDAPPELVTLPYAGLEHDWQELGAPYLLVYPKSLLPAQRINLQYIPEYDIDADINQSKAWRAAVQRLSTPAEPLERFFWLLNAVQQQTEVSQLTYVLEAVEIYQALPAEQRPWRAWAANVGAFRILLDNGYWPKIIELTDDVLARPGLQGLEEIYFWRGYAYWWTAQNSKAMADIQMVIRLQPDYPGAQQVLDRLMNP